MMSTFGRALVLLVMVNLLVGVLAFGVHAPWLVPAEAMPARPGLPSQVRQLQDRINQGHHGETYVLVLTDADLTALANYVVSRSSDVPFRDVRVTVVGNQIVADGVTKGMAVALPVRVRAMVAARDGLPVVRVEDVSLGSLAVPGFVRDEIVRRINTSLDFTRYHLPVTVDSVRLQNGQMTVSGTVK